MENDNLNNENNDPGGDPVKLFTQEEVNEIIKNRLARKKEEAAGTEEEITKRVEAATAEKIKELTALQNKLDCRKYLLDEGLPEDFLDVLDTSDPEVFKANAEKMLKAVKSSSRSYSAPLGSGEATITGKIPNEFSRTYKHTPREFLRGE